MSGSLVLDLVSGLAWAIPGVYLARHRPSVVFGWLALLAAAGHWVAAGLDGFSTGSSLAAIAHASEVIEQPVLMAMYALFPGGRLPRTWLRWPSLLSLALAVAGIPLAATHVELVPALFGPSALLALAVLALRWKMAPAEDRHVLRWLLVVGISVTVVTIPAVALFPTTVGTAVGLGLTLVELSVVVAATLRHHVYGVDVVLSRALLYSLLTVLVATVFVAVVAIAALVGAESDGVPAFVAAALCVIALAPARSWLQRRVDAFVYGDSGDPYAVVSSLATSFAGASTPHAVLSAYVERMRDALHVPWVQITFGAPKRTVGSGVARGPSSTIPIIHRGQVLGELVVALRRGENRLRRREQTLLSDLASHAALVLDSITLAANLQESREQVVAAREEERRRLRMDLHDGLGPQLTGIAMGLDVVSEKVDQRDVVETMERLRSELIDALEDVRRLVAGLRPPRLDDVGLAGAIAEAVDRAGRGGLDITFVGRVGSSQQLPAAVEVAILRIAEEAVTNVVRHAQATKCHVELAIGDHVTLVVEDNGVGGAGMSGGIGLESMKHRSEELGGSFVIDKEHQEGWRLSVSVPLYGAGGAHDE
jgi:signal transduction histidine kinase